MGFNFLFYFNISIISYFTGKLGCESRSPGSRIIILEKLKKRGFCTRKMDDEFIIGGNIFPNFSKIE